MAQPSWEVAHESAWHARLVAIYSAKFWHVFLIGRIMALADCRECGKQIAVTLTELCN